jgi:DNA-binding Xre family transcriptional regulator
MTAIERLFKYIEFQNIKHTGLEKKIGISNGYLTKMLQNKASIGSDIMEKIVSYCENLSAEWLLTGKGSMIIENNPLFFI